MPALLRQRAASRSCEAWRLRIPAGADRRALQPDPHEIDMRRTLSSRLGAVTDRMLGDSEAPTQARRAAGRSDGRTPIVEPAPHSLLRSGIGAGWKQEIVAW
jgi:hypothetical protein